MVAPVLTQNKKTRSISRTFEVVPHPSTNTICSNFFTTVPTNLFIRNSFNAETGSC